MRCQKYELVLRQQNLKDENTDKNIVKENNINYTSNSSVKINKGQNLNDLKQENNKLLLLREFEENNKNFLNVLQQESLKNKCDEFNNEKNNKIQNLNIIKQEKLETEKLQNFNVNKGIKNYQDLRDDEKCKIINHNRRIIKDLVLYDKNNQLNLDEKNIKCQNKINVKKEEVNVIKENNKTRNLNAVEVYNKKHEETAEQENDLKNENYKALNVVQEINEKQKIKVVEEKDQEQPLNILLKNETLNKMQELNVVEDNNEKYKALNVVEEDKDKQLQNGIEEINEEQKIKIVEEKDQEQPLNVLLKNETLNKKQELSIVEENNKLKKIIS
ncbi:hypothetical protein NAPIS_ORF00976 [Vairimorpha apis BRL 01]|uniref:Uncharacterized protein n=1 Tax=Vairimorpha apis BRL 01 TaxID=1037528 RepID=T0MEG3_9MICR|nr:hypothetical protein NAPIS_ORF00976 [Vairimorpha apis BRL 01]